jgi:hypothetical protein
LIEDLSKTSPDKEIGVVTFNMKQQTYIYELMEERFSNKKLTIPAGLFIKNIENVQGDEKDIIIFSIGYAPDEKGRMNMQFGSLNQVNGENRLNVAVTRAKEKIYVVTSIYPDQLKTEETKNEGPKLLKEYLEYARQISEKRFEYKTQPTSAFGAEWYLKYKLKEAVNSKNNAIELRNQMPFADLTVMNKDNFCGLIVTDDDLYHGSYSVKEAHVYTPFSFSNKNWRFLDFYSREYWQNPKAVIERFEKFVHAIDV